MPLQKNTDYKLKYRPAPPSYYAKYINPLPMTGNPPEARDTKNWAARAEIIYDRMMADKQGPAYVPAKSRKGLWFYAIP